MARTPPARIDPFERDRGRLARYKERREFYEGGQWPGRPRRRQAQLTVNYARALVRKVVSYALPDRVGFTVPAPVLADRDAADAARDGHEGAPEGETQAALPDLVRARRRADDAQANRVETLLAELLAELDADRLDFALAIDSAVLGDGVIKVTWDVAAGRPRLTAVDPATLLAWWSPDTPTEAYRFAQHYQLPGQAITNLGWAAAGALVPDRLYPVTEDWTAERWTVTVAGQTARDETNPYGWLPYLVLPNNPSGSQFWGESDLDDLIDVCRQINTRVSALADILDLAGWPITVLENVDSAEGITVGPGARWELPEGAKAYLLNLLKDGGVEQHVAYIDELRTALHDLAETPRTAFGESGRAIAGAALQVELQPLVQKVKRKRRGMESLYRRRNAMLLDLMERFGGEPVCGLRRTVPVWPPILPNDREADARIGVQLVNAGVRSRRSVAADLGEEDPEAEMARIVAEARQMAGLVQRTEGDEQDTREAPDGESTQGGRNGAARPRHRRQEPQMRTQRRRCAGRVGQGGQRRQAGRRASQAPGDVAEQATLAIARARTKLGAPYVLATAGPETFDCSGFTWWVAQPLLGPLDYELRSSHHQFNAWGERVPGEDLRPGDLLFFDSMGVTVFGNRASHVGLYLGDGQMIHAANEAEGVIVSRPFEGWYGPRLIGARRIFGLGGAAGSAAAEPEVIETPPRPPRQVHRAPKRRRTLPLLTGPIVTRNQWNGGPFPVDWSAAAGWAHEVNVAAREARVDARIIAAVTMMETQFTHERDGEVLTVWDNFPQDGPSVGMMQFKPLVYAHVRPDLDPSLPEENLRRGAAILAFLLKEEGGDLDAAIRRWFPAPAPNGTTPDRYLTTFWELLREMDYAA